MNGWILLHKKIWDNPLLYGNGNAILVWLWLLTHCNNDGAVTCGRNQIGKDCGINPETVRYWLTRFLQENHQLTTIKTTNKFSTFQICNWKEYQRKTTNPSTRKLPATYQPPTTNKEERIKNKEDIDTSALKKQFPLKNIQVEYEKMLDYLKASGKTYKDYQAFARNWLRKTPNTLEPYKETTPKVIHRADVNSPAVQAFRDKAKQLSERMSA